LTAKATCSPACEKPVTFDRLGETTMSALDELEPVKRRLGDLEEAVLAGTASAAEVTEYVLLAAAYGASLGIEQPALLTVADIADHFTETTGETVSAALVQTWRARYGPDRPAEAIRKAPTFPASAMAVGLRKPIDVWLAGQLPQIDAWRKSLPGQGAGGGRPARGL
jgi:hypothetical protein